MTLEPQLVELGRLDPPSVLLGSVTQERVLMDGRAVNQYHVEGPEASASSRILRITSRLLLPDVVHQEAFMIWRKAQTDHGKRRHVVTAAVWIAARLHGRDVEPEDICGVLNHRRSRRGASFVWKANKLAQDLGIDVPRLDHDRTLLRTVDELGVDREVYHQVKSLYPEARKVRGGDPRTTLAALVYHVAKCRSEDVTQGKVARKFGLMEETVRSAHFELKRRMKRLPRAPGAKRKSAPPLPPFDQETMALARELLNLGLSQKTTRLVIGELNPGLKGRHILPLVGRKGEPTGPVPGVPGLLLSLLSKHDIQASGRDANAQDRIPVEAVAVPKTVSEEIESGAGAGHGDQLEDPQD